MEAYSKGTLILCYDSTSSCANWDDLTTVVAKEQRQVCRAREVVPTKEQELLRRTDVDDDSGYRQKGSQVLPKVRI